MASPAIPPLRYQKGSNNASPVKGPTGRPLSELSPMAIRRNSPSFPQSRSSLLKSDLSPTSSSPFSNNNNSPRLFWHGKDPSSPSRENRNPLDTSAPTSPSKRSSIENLKKASRVKNSNMFAKEQQHNYDPARPKILDGRPLSGYLSSNALSGRASDGMLNHHDQVSSSPAPEHRSDFVADIQPMSPSNNGILPLSPSKTNASPTKSSLSKKTGLNMRYSGFDPDTGIWEDEDDHERKLPEGRGLHRRGKSVTFDQAPPQVNEYEMTTPDPSSVASGSREGSYESFDDEEEEYSYERGSSVDVDDSFDASLEDTDKTPVVLPEDWRFMSPDIANTQLSQHEKDVFDDDVGSPAPSAQPGRIHDRPHQTSVNSVDSNGQPRPLPPLPPSAISQATPKANRNSLSGAIERMSSGQRALPSPPPAASISKSDLRRMSRDSLSIEDRLKLMMINKPDDQARQEGEAQRERRMRRAASRDDISATQLSTSEPADDSMLSAGNLQSGDLAPKLDRLTIMRQLNATQEQESDVDEYDPDIPIPSLEDPTQPALEEDDEPEIKDEESEIDVYDIPDLYSRRSGENSQTEDEEGSQYSHTSFTARLNSNSQPEVETPRAQTPVQRYEQKPTTNERMSLPDFTDFGDEHSFNFGLDSYMTPPSDLVDVEKPLPKTPSEPTDLPDLEALRQSIQRPYTPEEQLEPPKLSFSGDESSAEPGTPSSVIRHPVSPTPESEPEKGNQLSRTTTASSEVPHEEVQIQQPTNDTSDTIPSLNVGPATVSADRRVSSLVQLEIPSESIETGLGLGLEAEFDRVVEAQKRGYLMRQNTKVVVASERLPAEESAPQQPITGDTPGLAAAEPNEVVPSLRKASQPTWTAEPWNGKSRRRSIRVGGEKATAKRKPVDGPAPPLPGQASAVQDGLGSVTEDDLAEAEAEEAEDGVERGRLFVKVVGVKDLQLPLPHHERTHFALTLDNGLHCVTTAWLDLASEAPIGQEFELVVLNDLEFQLTLQMKLEEPKVERPSSPSKPAPSPKKQGAFGRLFGSPKKKKDSDVRVSQDVYQRPTSPPSVYELVQGLVAKDGSFARAYVSLSEHEKQAFGRPYTVDIKCFNEWAMEAVPVGSSRSKKGMSQLQRRPPYEIGKLELQLLYVPKPKGAKDEDMPKSMNGAVRALKEAEEKLKQQATIKDFEGFLSQQGGDCPYWRRRFFKLVGSKLTAYHETTLQPRATINLSKANKLIDDKSTLTQKETSTKGGGRRKSAFAEEEEGYMFVEEGFRIRFANGEVIDFYADAPTEKDAWMQALSQVVGKNINASATQLKAWTEMVLKREKSLAAKSKTDQTIKKHTKHHSVHDPTSVQATAQPASSIPLATSRPSHARAESFQTAGTRTQTNSPVKQKISPEERRAKARSMVF